jgi:N-acetylglucosamine-6-phosphate deacetylase
MSLLLIQNARLLSAGEPWSQGWILIDGDRIAQMGMGPAPAFESAQVINGAGQTVLPGFIDLHVHGGVGHDTMDGTPEALQAFAQLFATCGVTSFLATTMTGSKPDIDRALKTVAACTGPMPNGASILGVHLEGPYINLKMKGAQIGEQVRRADPAEYLPWLDLNVIKQTTVAPEYPENQKFIQDCVARNVNVSVGHTEATYEDVKKAVELGARQTTHTFNAMIGLHHRKPGTVGGALSEDQLTCELIPDTIHVHPAVLKIVIRAKGIGSVVLITDAMMGAGMPDGQYELGGQAVNVSKGQATLADGTLAGSILRMDEGVRNIIAATGMSIDDVWPMTSANQARQLGIGDRKGKLAVGYDADVVLLDSTNHVQLTVAAGRIVYQAQ